MTTAAPITENAQPLQQGSWYETLGDSYKENPSITKFENVEGLAKSYLSLESMLGQEKIPVPKNAEDEGAWSLYNKAFKIPETSDKYELAPSEELGEFREQIGDLQAFKDIMHKHRIPPEAAQGLLDTYLGEIKGSVEKQEQQVQAQMTEAQTSLQKEWGNAYEDKIKGARDVLAKLAGDEENFNYFNSKIGNDAKFIKLLASINDKISEGSLGGLDKQSGSFAKTPSEANQEFNDILNNPSNPKYNSYRTREASDHKEVVAYVNGLIGMMG